MNKEIIDKIENEIDILLGELTNVYANSEDYKEITLRIQDLYSIINNESKLEIDKDRNFNDSEKLATEEYLKRKELRQEKILVGLKTSIDVLAVVAPLVFYGIWMNRGLEFEKEGSFTSSTFKGLFGKFKPTK